MDYIPGMDRGALVAAFAGAVAYLCTQDKMPVLRAVGYVVAGGVAAAYIGPGILEHLSMPKAEGGTYGWVIGEKVRYASIFITGVCGIWLLNIIVEVMRVAKEKCGTWMGGLFDRVFGNKPNGGQ